MPPAAGMPPEMGNPDLAALMQLGGPPVVGAEDGEMLL
jgi:hypothetical protein